MDSIQALLAKRTDFSTSDNISTPITDPAPPINPLLDTNTPTKSNTPNTELPTKKHIDHEKITQIFLDLRSQIDAALLFISTNDPSTPPPPNHTNKPNKKNPEVLNHNTKRGEMQIIEGVFNGEKMVGPDGHEYSIPSNYASKSKLVEGDMMKLSISPTGAFVYKQIGPIERRRLIGETTMDTKTGQWSVSANNKTYKILTASASFFHAKHGMQAVILVPKDGESRWAAVENIFHPNQY